MNPLYIGALRQILQIIGGWLIAKGWLDDGSLDAIIGIVINGAVFVWWLVDRRRARKNVEETVKETTGSASAAKKAAAHV